MSLKWKGVCTLNIEKLPELVELNVGNWKIEAVYVIDSNFKIWASKGDVKNNILNYYRKFPLSEMEVGDIIIHNKNSFLLKVTEKTGVIVVTPEPHYSLVVAANLKGRINALNEFYKLDELIQTR